MRATAAAAYGGAARRSAASRATVRLELLSPRPALPPKRPSAADRQHSLGEPTPRDSAAAIQPTASPEPPPTPDAPQPAAAARADAAAPPAATRVAAAGVATRRGFWWRQRSDGVNAVVPFAREPEAPAGARPAASGQLSGRVQPTASRPPRSLDRAVPALSPDSSPSRAPRQLAFAFTKDAGPSTLAGLDAALASARRARTSTGSQASAASATTDATTADEALTDANLTLDELPLPELQKRKLRLALRVMRRTATAERPAYEMRDTELRELFAEFERLDSSANHALALDEMGRFLRRVGMKVSRDEAQALLELLDHDGSGQVEFAELMGWYLEHMQDFHAEELERRAHRSPLRVFWEERLRLPPWARHALAWALSWALFAVCAVITVTYGVVFGEKRFDALLKSWGLGLAQTMVAEEPIMIWTYMLVPVAIEAISSNDLAAQLLNAFVSSIVGNCLSGLVKLCKLVNPWQ